MKRSLPSSVTGIVIGNDRWSVADPLAAGFVYFTSYNLLVNKYAPELPHYGSCDGTVSAAFSGAAILTSYLFLFIAFYFATYKKGRKTAGKDKQDIGITHTVSTGKDSALGALKRVNINLARKGEAALPIVSQRD